VEGSVLLGFSVFLSVVKYIKISPSVGINSEATLSISTFLIASLASFCSSSKISVDSAINSIYFLINSFF